MLSKNKFYDQVLTIAVPITLQSVVMALLTMTDQIMIGQLGDVAIASVGISSKLTAIFSVVLAGIASGISIYCAQFYGKQDCRGIHQLLGLGVLIGSLFSIPLAIVIALFPELIMSAFTHDVSVLSTGAIYVEVVALSYFPTMLTMMYSSVLRSTGRVKLPMYVSMISVVINIALNYALIFGHAGFDAMGIKGAAIATVYARVAEVLIIIVCIYRFNYPGAVKELREVTGISPQLVRKFALTTYPIVLAELLWILGESAYAVIYGRMGTVELTAMTMSYPLQSLSVGLLTGLSGAAAVLIGQRLGAGEFTLASDYARKIIRLGIYVTIVLGAVMAVLSPFYVSLYETSSDAKQMGIYCILVFSGFLWVKVSNMIVAAGVLNAGGDSRYVFMMESLATWCVGVPSGFAFAFIFEFSIHWVYLILSIEEVVRFIFGYSRVRSKRWVRSLVDNTISSQPS